MKLYWFQLKENLSPQDLNVCFEFCLDVQQIMEQEDFAEKLIFSDGSTFHVCGRVKTHEVRIWGMPNHKEILRRSSSNKMGQRPIIWTAFVNFSITSFLAFELDDNPATTVATVLSGSNSMLIFLWDFVNDLVLVPPIPRDLQDLCQRITTAFTTTDRDMLKRAYEDVWF